MKHVVDESVTITPHLIRPEHISTARDFMGSFGHSETEFSARWIVRLCRSRDSWLPFTDAEMRAFQKKAGQHSDFEHYRLISDGFIVKGRDRKNRVTHEFICRCFAASPAEGLFSHKDN